MGRIGSSIKIGKNFKVSWGEEKPKEVFEIKNSLPCQWFTSGEEAYSEYYIAQKIVDKKVKDIMSKTIEAPDEYINILTEANFDEALELALKYMRLYGESLLVAFPEDKAKEYKQEIKQGFGKTFFKVFKKEQYNVLDNGNYKIINSRLKEYEFSEDRCLYLVNKIDPSTNDSVGVLDNKELLNELSRHRHYSKLLEVLANRANSFVLKFDQYNDTLSQQSDSVLIKEIEQKATLFNKEKNNSFVSVGDSKDEFLQFEIKSSEDIIKIQDLSLSMCIAAESYTKIDFIGDSPTGYNNTGGRVEDERYTLVLESEQKKYLYKAYLFADKFLNKKKFIWNLKPIKTETPLQIAERLQRLSESLNYIMKNGILTKQEARVALKSIPYFEHIEDNKDFLSLDEKTINLKNIVLEQDIKSNKNNQKKSIV